MTEKKIGGLEEPKKLLINGVNRVLLWGVEIFGLLPISILREIGGSLLRASDRYIYIVSVPNMYHSLGRGV